MNTEKSHAKRAFIAIAVVLLMIIPLLMGVGYVFWASANNEGSGYKFWAGLFGSKNVDEPVFAYDSQYASAKPVSPDFKSPVYVLGDSTLIDIENINYGANLPENATKELYVPSGMRYEGMGLFVCYLDDNGDFAIAKTTTRAGLELFDENKPTLVFIHGMQYQNGARSDEGSEYLSPLIKAGYNVLLFRWSQLTDEPLPSDIEPKIWGTTKDKSLNMHGLRWMDASGKYIEDDIPNASIAEMFGGYYVDFMSRFDYKGAGIQITGHSMGGQLAAASASYLLAKEQEGLISPALLPDKVTLFDPYISPLRDEVYCDWLGYKISRDVLDAKGKPVYTTINQPKFTSCIDIIVDIAKALRDRGIGFEYVPAITGYVPLLLKALEPNDTTLIDSLYANSVVFEHRTDWVPITDFNGFHGAGKNWYFKTALYDYMYDNAMDNPIDLAPSARIPLSYFFARIGTTYVMEENMTPDIEDDVLSSANVTCAKVAGFAFEDTNGNRSYDERVQARMANVKVELYHKDGRERKLIATCITDQAGYYSFDIPQINANGFDMFYIRAVAPQGYDICGRGASSYLMDNDINPTDNLSDEFSLKHFRNLKILNVGLVKEANA